MFKIIPEVVYSITNPIIHVLGHNWIYDIRPCQHSRANTNTLRPSPNCNKFDINNNRPISRVVLSREVDHRS